MPSSSSLIVRQLTVRFLTWGHLSGLFVRPFQFSVDLLDLGLPFLMLAQQERPVAVAQVTICHLPSA